MRQARDDGARGVSILLPTYNSAKYIDEQIGSIVEQTFPDFELLVYDDGSSDETLAILGKWQAADPRIRVIAGSQNEGQNRCLAKLFRMSQGRYIAFSDHDDVWHREKLERLHARIERDRCGLVFGASHLIDAQGQELGQTLHDQAKLEICPQDHLRLLFFPVVSGHATLIERDLLWDGTFAGPMLFDWHFSLDAQFTKGIEYEPAAITYHRIHGGNFSNGDPKRWTRDVRFFRDMPYPRSLLSSGYEDRIRFYKRLSYLGSSPIIPAKRQALFAAVAGVCEHAWFASLTRRTAYKHRCSKLLQDSLLPLASNDADRESAAKNIAALCSSFRRRRSFTIAR